MKEIVAEAICPDDSIIFNHMYTQAELPKLQVYCDVLAVAQIIISREVQVFTDGNTQSATYTFDPQEPVLHVPKHIARGTSVQTKHDAIIRL